MITKVVWNVLLGILLVELPPVCATEAVRFADLQGTYVSAVHGGCVLELRNDGSFSLTCGSWQRNGRAIPLARGFSIGGSGDTAEVLLPPPAAPGRAGDWPPSLRDPTRGPYVVPGPEPGDSFWLEPLRWGARLYLIRGGSYYAFCQAVKAGVEPRKTPTGDQFLRRGDQLKPVGPKPPKECDDLK
jgi:hypothetical protein